MISLVYAASQNDVIGKAGGLPWQVPSDLKQFKAITVGKPIIMGRKTWESLPKRPLPGRKNIIITRQQNWRAEGAEIAHDAQAAIALAGLAPEICVIGGAEIFNLFLPLAKRIYLTRILGDVDGDTYAPEINPQAWHIISQHHHEKAENDSHAFDTLIYERI